MRITFVLPHIDISGGIKVALEYADFLARHHHQVTVIYPSRRPPPLRQRVRNFIRRITPVGPTPYGSSLLATIQIKPVHSKRVGILLAADVPNADIVVATWWETAEWVHSFPKTKGQKVYLVQGHEIFEGLPKERVQKTYSMPFTKVVVSSWLADTISREYSKDFVKLVRNGVDIDRFRDKAGVRTSLFTVGMIYSSVPQKNAEMGIRAIIEARQALPHLKAIIFGLEPRPASISGLEWVEYYCRPSQSDIPELYRRSHVWLFSSHSEGFGLPLLEAMASGTPVIATRAGAAPELVDGKNGVLVDWKYQDMSKNIQHIANLGQDAWLEMSRHARATAEMNSWESAALKFERELLNLLSSKQSK